MITRILFPVLTFLCLLFSSTSYAQGLECQAPSNSEPMAITCTPIENFIPNTTDELLIVKLVFHIIQKPAPAAVENFQENNPSHEAFLNDVVVSLNNIFSNSDDMYCFGGYVQNTGYVKDSRIRFELTEIKFEEGASCEADDYTELCVDGKYHFMFCKNDNSSSLGGSASSFFSRIYNAYDWYLQNVNNPAYVDQVAGLLAHEFGHSQGIDHADLIEQQSMFPDICQDQDQQYNVYCSIGQSDHCSNNIMSTSNSQGFISPLQMAHMRLRLITSNTSSAYIKFEYDVNKSIIISQNTVWDEVKLIYGDVIIEHPATLTINCDVKMTAGSRIIVKRGARLIVNDATISSQYAITPACYDLNYNKKWTGIEVWGNTNVLPNEIMLSETYQLGQSDPGVVNLNGAKIENALVGIFPQQRGYPWSSQLEHFGGLIKAQNAIFRNCRWGVQYISHRPIKVPSTFSNCEFRETNLSLAAEELPFLVEPTINLQLNQEGITSWQVSGITVGGGCNFRYLSNAIVVGDATIDVHSSSFFKVKNGVILGTSAPAFNQVSNIGSSFAGSGNTFEKCDFGLIARPYGFLFAGNNLFKNSNKIGIQIEGASIYELNENKFLQNILKASTIDGIELRQSAGFGESRIRCSEYITTDRAKHFDNGILAAGNNSSTYFLGNKFASIHDVNVQAISTFDPNGVFVQYMGELPNQGTVQNAVFNEFTLAGTNHQSEIQTPPVTSGLSQFFTYWVPTTDCNLLTIPKKPLKGVCSKMPPNNPPPPFHFENALGATEGGAFNCSFGPVDGLTRPVPCSYPSCLEWYYTRIDSLDSRLNPGASPSLISLIHTLPNQSSTLQALTEASPYLSDNTLNAVIQSDMADADKLNVLIANIPLTPYIVYEASNYLPVSFVDSILGLQDQSSDISVRDEARQSRISLNNAKMSLLKQYVDSLYTAGAFAEAVSLLSNDPERHSREALVGLTLRMGDFTGASQLLNNYPESTREDIEFKFIQTINLQLLENGNGWLPSAADSVTLYALAENYSPQAAFAKTMLWVLYDTVITNELPIYAEGRSAMPPAQKGQAEKMTASSGSNWVVYPNPAAGSITIELINYSPGLQSCFRLYNALGVELRMYHVYSNVLNIDLGDVEKGTYLLQYSDNTGALTTKWLAKW